jgi:hypothetical protein
MACLALWVVLLYFPPTLPRIAWGYHWFVTRARYRYITCIPAAAIAVLWISSLRPFTRAAGRGFLRVACGAFIALVICANIREIVVKERFVHDQSNSFKRIEAVFLAELRQLLQRKSGTEIVMVIRDKPFAGPGSSYAGWNAKPGLVCRLHLSRNELRKVRFIADEDEDATSPRLYFVEKATGHIIRVRP